MQIIKSIKENILAEIFIRYHSWADNVIYAHKQYPTYKYTQDTHVYISFSIGNILSG